VSGGLCRRTGVLGWRGQDLTRRVGTLPLTTAEDLPSSREFWEVCGDFISARRGKLAFLATQSHAQLSTPCDCVAKTASLPMLMAITISQGSIYEEGVLYGFGDLYSGGGNGCGAAGSKNFVPKILPTWNQNSYFCFRAGKFWSAAPSSSSSSRSSIRHQC